MENEHRNQAVNQILKVLPLALGLLIGIVFVRSLGSLPLKWNVFIFGGIVGLCGLALFGTLTTHLRGAMMFLAIASLPTFYEIVLGFRPGVKFSVLANGFPVTLFDVFFFPLCGAWLFQRWLDPRPDSLRFPKNWATFLGLMLVINLGNAIFVAREPFFSYSIIFTQAKGCVIVFMMANMIKTEHSFRVVGYAMAAILVIEGLVVMEQRFLGVLFTAENLGRLVSLKSKVGSDTLVRLAGTLNHPNDLAMYLNLCLPVTFFMYLIERKGVRRIFLASALALALISEIWSGSRGAWLGLGVAIGSSLFFWMRKRGQNPLVGLGAMALTVTLLFAVLFAASGTFRARLVEGDAGAAEIRYPLMEVAVEMIKSNPVQGVGLNLYTREMVPYDRTNYFIAYRYNHPVHNTFLMVGAETGLLSMLVLASFIFFLILEAHRVFARNSGVVEAIGIGVFGTLVCWLIHNQVNLTGPFSDQTLWVIFGLLAAARLYRQQDEADQILISRSPLPRV
jgi:putative inorganic carbon (HCO3(-)) transporter